MRRARKICNNKLAVGFGVSRREQVEELLKAGADGVVVGSALIELISRSENPVEELRRKVAELSGYSRAL